MHKPTEAELEILQILWKQGASTVKTVNQELNRLRPAEAKSIGYTTTLKMMQVMLEKGMLSRDSSQRQHVYQADLSEDATQKNLIDRLLETAFGGSALKLVMQALGNKRTSQAELAEIKKMIDQIEQEKGGEK